MNAEVEKILDSQGGMITARQVAAAGLSRTMLSRYVREQKLERVRSAIYVRPDGMIDEFLLLNLRVPRGVLSHAVSLFLNELTDRTPFDMTLTLGSRDVLTVSLRSEVKCFYVPDELLELGVVTRKTPLGNEVRCYDAERTVCDLIRNRNRLDEELVLDGLRQYAVWPDRNLAKLGDYAKAFGILETVRRTLEVAL